MYKWIRETVLRKETKCKACKSREKLVVHHLNYKNKGFETSKDVLLLCEECHNQIHRLVKGYDDDLERITWLYVRNKF